MKSREVVARLQADGWIVRRIVGGHHQLIHPTKPGKATAPIRKAALPAGTLTSIEKQAGVKLRR